MGSQALNMPEDPAGSNVCQLKTRMWGEVGASQVPQPTCWWKWATPCQAGTLSRSRWVQLANSSASIHSPSPPSPLSSRALSSEYWFLHKAGKAGRKKGARHQKQNTSHFVTSTAFINYEHRRIFLCAMCSKISAGQSGSKFLCPSKNITGYLFQFHEPASWTWFSISF